MSRRQMIETLLRNAEQQVPDDFCECNYSIVPEYDILQYIGTQNESVEGLEQVEPASEQFEHESVARDAEENEFVNDLVACGLSLRNARHIKTLIDDLSEEEKDALKKVIVTRV